MVYFYKKISFIFTRPSKEGGDFYHPTVVYVRKEAHQMLISKEPDVFPEETRYNKHLYIF